MGTCWDCGTDDVIVSGNRCAECAHVHQIRLYLLKMFVSHTSSDVPMLEESPELSDSD